MTIYFLIGVVIVLAGVAALQLFYMSYLERLGKEQRHRISELEKHSAHLSHRLNDAEDNLTRQAEIIQAMEYYEDDEVLEEEEVWADVIEES
jgi:ABC-type protease/lipase transport system fused ATPase/permease subunit